MHIEEPEFENNFEQETLNLEDNHPEIFKYTQFEGGLKILRDKTIALRSPVNMNDPFDCDISTINFNNITRRYLKYVLDKRQDIFDNTTRKNFLLKGINNDAYNKAVEDFKLVSHNNLLRWGLTCFSENYSNLLMWSHYTKSHAGICIGFDTRKLFLSIIKSSQADRMIRKVKYSDTFPILDYFKHPNESLTNWLTVKSSAWSYEKEIRILFHDLTFNSDGLCIKSIDPESIKSIYLGYKISKENETEIRELIDREFKGVTIKKINREPKTYNLF